MMEGTAGKVVRICSRTEVIISLGSNNGVEPGMRFRIVSEPVEVADVDGSSLGAMVMIKGVVIARSVFEKFTLAQTEGRVRQRKVSRSPGLVGIFGGGPTTEGTENYTQHDELWVDASKVAPLDRQRTVTIGDRVELIPA